MNYQAHHSPGGAIGGGGVKSLRGAERDGKQVPVGFCLQPERRVMFSEAFVFAARPGNSRRGGGEFDRLAAASE